MSENKITINVPMLARVEGEGALWLNIENNELTDVRLSIYEPPRFFEKLLEGKHYTDVPDIVARICGICPVAYQMSAIHAFENLFQFKANEWIRNMRRVFYCGEWIESHSLHIHLLAAPDFLGFESAPAMAKQFPQEVKRGLRLQHIGNQIIRLFGGRSVHPVGACAGGFFRAPSLKDARALLTQIEEAIPLAEQLVVWTSQLPLPNQDVQYVHVAMQTTDEYPMNHGIIASNNGLSIDAGDFPSRFSESQVEHSTALHCHLDGKPYLVGPLARMALNPHQLPTNVRRHLEANNVALSTNNMFHSIIARAIEINIALHEAKRLLTQYAEPAQAHEQLNVRAGIAVASTEAPRGILWHSYEVDSNGYVTNARIVPPTSQNQANIELELRTRLIEFGLDKPEADIRLMAEKIIRNYDPCISCATHFLDLRLTRQ